MFFFVYVWQVAFIFCICLASSFGRPKPEGAETSYGPPPAPVYPPTAVEPAPVYPASAPAPVYPATGPLEYPAPIIPEIAPVAVLPSPVLEALHHTVGHLLRAKVNAVLAVKPKILSFVLDKAANVLKFKSHVLAGWFILRNETSKYSLEN